MTIANFMIELICNQTKICSIGTTRIDFLSRVIEDVCPCTPKIIPSSSIYEPFNARKWEFDTKIQKWITD